MTYKGIKRRDLANIALAMSGVSDKDNKEAEELIHELEEIIKQLRGSEK